MSSMRGKNRARRGSTILEFALASVLLIPLLLGTVGLGMTLGSYITALQTTRDTAHMFARGIDFSTAANKDIAVRLATGLNLTRTGIDGNGSLIFSKIITPKLEDCTAAGVVGTNCKNLEPVVIHRLRIGNDLLLVSQYGQPDLKNLASVSGNIKVTDYLKEPSVRATAFGVESSSAGLAQERGEIAYVVEGFFNVPALHFLGYAKGGMYCRFVF